MSQKNPRSLRRGGRWDGGGNLLTGQKLHEFVEFIQEIVAVLPTAFLQCPLLKTASIMPVVRAIHIGGDSWFIWIRIARATAFGEIPLRRQL